MKTIGSLRGLVLMRRAYTLMTALPPTTGHLDLIRFASGLADEVIALVVTQPHEPYVQERYRALRDAVPDNVKVRLFNRQLEQNPDAPGFWNMWKQIMTNQGMNPGDIFVSSETYGQTMADVMGGIFMPYDPKRELNVAKASNIRGDMWEHFDEILPQFQPNLISTVTVFGAESTGKTTLSKWLAKNFDGHWRFEWARPYLETVGPDITVDSMEAIWKGQKALQQANKYLLNKSFIFQDTDLFSTVGYWEQPHWAKTLGRVPAELVKDAQELKSELYIITKSNIDFEPDPLRYGGDHRESPDEFWIGIADKYDLNYVVLEDSHIGGRVLQATEECDRLLDAKHASIRFDRTYND
jgi:HTH-type transcriptional regulator, transcriptional repressor of NAD biosynthesis genes